MNERELRMNELDTSCSVEVDIKKPSKALAIIAMLCGFLSVISFFLGIFSFAFGLVALTLAIISLATKKRGKGMAITGIVFGTIGLFIGIVSIYFFWGVYVNAVKYGEYEYIFEDMLDCLGLGVL